MKKFALVALGLLAGLVAFITAVWAVKGDLIGAPIAAAAAYGTYAAFRKAARIITPPKAYAPRPREARPWER